MSDNEAEGEDESRDSSMESSRGSDVSQKRKRVTLRDSERLKIVIDFNTSGKTMRKYCEDTGIPQTSLYEWSQDVKDGILTEESCLGKKKKAKKTVTVIKTLDFIKEENVADRSVMNMIKEHRESRKLLNIDRILLHSTSLAKTWFIHYNCLDNRLNISPQLREFTILFVALRNNCEYFVAHHCKAFLTAGGTIEQLSEIKEQLKRNNFSLRNSSRFTLMEQNIAELCFVILGDKARSQMLIHNINKEMGATATVEILALILNYTTSCYFVETLDIPLER